MHALRSLRGAMRPMGRAVAAAAVFIAALPGGSAAGTTATRLCTDAADGLSAGRVAIVERAPVGGRGVALRACGTVEASPEAVWAVLRDCGKFEQFLPRVSHSRLTSRADNVVECDETIDMPFPLGDLHSVTRVVETPLPEGGFERRGRLVRGTYRHLEVAWVVLPADPTASRSLIVYEVDMDPETVIPDFVIQRAQSAAAPEVFRAVRERVQQCARGAAACGSESRRPCVPC